MAVSFSPRLWAHYLTARQAAEVNRRLKEAGFRSTAKQCREYVPVVVRRMAGADPDAARAVLGIIADVLNNY